MSKWPSGSKHLRTTFGGLSRSELMSRIRSSHNLTTELRLRALLRSAKLKGWRRSYPLPGKPDFVFSRARLTIFVDGCFWHGHQCGRNLTPRRNTTAWKQKIDATRRRDIQVTRNLRKLGWKVLRIWECDLSQRPTRAIRWIKRAMGAKRRNV